MKFNLFQKYIVIKLYNNNFKTSNLFIYFFRHWFCAIFRMLLNRAYCILFTCSMVLRHRKIKKGKKKANIENLIDYMQIHKIWCQNSSTSILKFNYIPNTQFFVVSLCTDLNNFLSIVTFHPLWIKTRTYNFCDCKRNGSST